MRHKKKDHKGKILSAAMDVWAKTQYQNTSLNLVAKRLNMTKQALYRYFPSKEGLLQALRDDFLAKFLQMHEIFLEKNTGAGENEFLKNLVNLYYTFFKSNRNHYMFFIRKIMGNPPTLRKETADLATKMTHAIEQLLARQAIHVKPVEINLSLRFLISAIILFLFPLFIKNRGGCPPPKIMDEGIWLEFIFTCCRRGILNDSLPKTGIDYERIEKTAEVTPEDIPPNDKLMDAIEAVVTEGGLDGTSIEQFAHRLGMSKSSLYFHFKNKDDMLGQLANTVQSHITGLLDKKVRLFGGFPECSYAFMVLLGSYTLNKPSLFTLFSWLRFQNIQLEFKPPDPAFLKEVFSFVLDGIRENELLPAFSQRPFLPAILLNILTMQTLIIASGEKPDKKKIFRELHILHRHCLYGLSGAFPAGNSQQKTGERYQ
ncbi:MAG: TetR/AcrR family transcriptional regulator [Spirochaetales bacterium]|nr:TetR/AcrR family transcriptional regulator [Spirochaetales bacterium]